MKRLCNFIVLFTFTFGFMILSGVSYAGTVGNLAKDDGNFIDNITMVRGTVDVDMPLELAVRRALVDASDVLPYSQYYAISGIRIEEDWALVSVVGLNNLDEEVGWRLEDNNWWGLIIARQIKRNKWVGAAEGTQSFSILLDEVPDHIIGSRLKHLLDPLLSDSMFIPAATSYNFPLTSGTSFYYGVKGVHSADYNGMWGTGTWKAIDLWSDGASGHSPNAVYAAATESITGAICKDNTSTAVKTPGLIYAHFIYNSNLYTGKTFNKGDYMGQLKTGSFSDSCGYASQSAGTYHLHWGFPNAPITASGWTLNPATGTYAPWVKGTDAKYPGNWIYFTNTTPPNEVIVDDLNAGFTKYGPSSYWWQASIGYNSHMWYTYVNGTTKSNYARWKPSLSYGAGNYTVLVFIPNNYATSQQAKYQIYHNGQSHYVTVNQNIYYNQWVVLGTYSFSGNGSEYVELADSTGEAPSTYRMLGFDAVKFVKN